MARLVKDIINDTASDLRVSQEAVAALHLATEPFLVRWFEMLYALPYTCIDHSNRCAIFGKRVTILRKDSEFLRDLIRMIDPSSPLAVSASMFKGRSKTTGSMGHVQSTGSGLAGKHNKGRKVVGGKMPRKSISTVQ